MTGTSVDVNLTWLAPGRVGGSEEYLTRQLAGLLLADDRHEFAVRLFCQPSFPAAHPELVARGTGPAGADRNEAPGLEAVITPLGRDWRGARIAIENSWLARRTRHADVVHHGGGTAPLVGNRSAVLTVHDLQYLEFPHYFSRVRREYLHRLMPGSVRRAQIVAVPSAFVRTTVIDAFGIEPGRVVVVPHGIPDMAEPDPEAIAAAQLRYGIEGPYVIYPAITHPHKGHRVLVEMLASTSSPSHPLHDLTVVFVGGEGAAEAALRRSIVDAGQTARVVRTGRIGSADRDALVAGSAAMVFPSEYEGFGAPLVEAMALGVPVVAGDHAAVAEVCGGAAVIVAGRHGEAWAAGVSRAIAERAELVARGSARRADFTLERSGAALATVYRSVASGVLA